MSSRLTASKRKDGFEPLSNGAKSYKGIREKVFSRRQSYPLVEVGVGFCSLQDPYVGFSIWGGGE